MPLSLVVCCRPNPPSRTACPLDCPDACTLDVTLRGGRVTKIDGSTENHITDGYICAKVRRFHERVYGDDRLLYPAVRRGAKGAGQFKRVTWDDALDLIAEKMQARATARGAETILPLCYGGSNGLLTQDYADAMLFRRFGASRLLRTVCAAPTGAANLGPLRQDGVGQLRGLPDAKMIIVWGVNPSVSGIHLMPYPQGGSRQRRQHRRASIRARRRVARQADLHLPVRPGTDLAGRARDSSLSVRRRPRRLRHFSTSTRRGAAALREKAAPWTFERAAEVSGIDADQLRAARRALRRRPRRRS